MSAMPNKMVSRTRGSRGRVRGRTARLLAGVNMAMGKIDCNAATKRQSSVNRLQSSGRRAELRAMNDESGTLAGDGQGRPSPHSSLDELEFHFQDEAMVSCGGRPIFLAVGL